MTDKTYDILARIGRIIIPALGTLYFALAKIWGLPFGVGIEGSCLAVAACLNTILKREYDKWEATTADDN